eukprot:scaffold362123_cov73-Cyclotella_meneghiniana.AAC.2
MVSESPLSKYNSLGMDKIGQGGCYKPASSTVTVSGCGDRANQKFLRGKGCKSLMCACEDV